MKISKVGHTYSNSSQLILPNFEKLRKNSPDVNLKKILRLGINLEDWNLQLKCNTNKTSQQDLQQIFLWPAMLRGFCVKGPVSQDFQLCLFFKFFL